MALVAFGMWLVSRFCDYYQPAKSSRSVLRYGPPGLAPIDRREVDVRANKSRSPVAVLEE